MPDEIEFRGGVFRLGTGPAAADIRVRCDEMWVYVEVVGDQLRVWTQRPCASCRRKGTRYLRCREHQGVMMIATQLDLI